jgi:FdrA protein
MSGDVEVEHLEVQTGAYADSVTLMQISQRAAAVQGVAAAIVAMGTELNLDLARAMGFAPEPSLGANDLFVAIRAADQPSLDAARAAVRDALAAPTPVAGPGGLDVAPARTTAAALRSAGANLAVVSVPGRFAFAEAADALAAGADVMIFSDNVPLAQEVALKQRAAAAGRLVMGPDCGTAVVGGVGLGFANVTRPGPVGIVAASGTGAQQLMCLLDFADVGISACLGVGGRDLSEAVGGLAALRALDLLDADPATELIVVVSKPPAPAVAAAVREHAARLTTPVVFGLLGPDQPDLAELAASTLAALGRPSGPSGPSWPSWPSWPAESATTRPGALRGLYAGGTLCDEAMLIAQAQLGEIRSNIPLRPEWALDDTLRHAGHLMIDFGDDALTQGRPHPMIDSTLRVERLAGEARDPDASVVLLDVVLGHGAHPDPAADLAPAIAAARAAGPGLQVVVALIGSRDDPQRTTAQAQALQSAGASVFGANADAARHAVALVREAAR